MKHEISQFYRALKARITINDESFLRQFLSHQEQIMFYRQRLADQRHALDTAYKIYREIEFATWIDRSKIMKMALLHDVGKAYVFMPLWVRPVVVLLKKYAPDLLAQLAEKGAHHNSRLFFKYFFSYVFHPELGEKMLEEIGVDKEVLRLISLHHEPPAPQEPPELPVFRRADSTS